MTTVRTEASPRREEIQRIRRVSDMLCTGHASLRDRYSGLALTLDIGVLSLSAWLVALLFVDPKIAVTLTPLQMAPTLWAGLLGAGTFILTLVQLKVDWKGRADAHRRAFDIYSEVKREAGYILAGDEEPDDHALGRVLSRYDMASALGVGIPENEFLPQKRRHLIKVAVSRHLDKFPNASIPLLKLKWWWRDNFDSKANSNTKADVTSQDD